MSESLARDDLERLIRAGFVPRRRAGWPHWIRASTGFVATIEELAAVLQPREQSGLSWVPPRLQAAATLALGEET